MAGLPHYRNSRISNQNWEPVYTNLFEVILELPEPLRSKYPENYVYLEQIKKIAGIETDKGMAAVEQFYKFAKRRFAASKPESTTVDLTIDFEVNLAENNQMYPYNVLRDWSYLTYDPQTGAMALKRDYVGSLVILAHNKIGEVYRKYVFPTIWISGNLPPIDFEYGSDAIYTMSVQFLGDYWQDLIIE